MGGVLAFLFLVVPFIELAVIIAVADRIGVGWTILLLILMSIAGGVLAKQEGLAVWRRLAATVREGSLPSDELMDAFLVLLGAALLLTPGFVTDVFGLVLLVPVSRPAVKRVASVAFRRFVARRTGLDWPSARRSGPASTNSPRKRAEVVEVRSADPLAGPKVEDIEANEP